MLDARPSTGQIVADGEGEDVERIAEAIREVQRDALVYADEEDLHALASKAQDFEGNAESFSVDDLNSLVSHFASVNKVSGDGTLVRKDFLASFALLGVHGFLVEVLFEAFTWDNEFSVSHISIRDFLCSFAMLVSGKTEEKLSVVFYLCAPPNTGTCPIHDVQELFRNLHYVLNHMSHALGPCEDFVVEMMALVHSVASLGGGQSVNSITLTQFIEACKRHTHFFACMDSLQDTKSGSLSSQRRSSTQGAVLYTRSSRYQHAGLTGYKRLCPCLFAAPPLSQKQRAGDEVLAMSQRLTSPEGRSSVVATKARSRDDFLDWLLGRDSWHTMLSFLLGVRRALERLALQDIKLTPLSFRKVRVMRVPGHTRGAVSDEVTLLMRDYAPSVFKKIRALYNIDDQEFIRSLSPIPILGNLLLGNLRKLSSLISEGKSGSLLYFSKDGRYVIKTVTRREHVAFLKVLQAYYDYIRSNPHTLLIRYFGLYDMKLPNGRVLYFTVMGNVFETKLSVHRRYDIKGSTKGRTALKGSTLPSHSLPSVCLKDNDLRFRFLLPVQVRRDLVVQLASDANWLSQHNLIDYSLLIGIHFPARESEAGGGPERLHTEPKWRSRFQHCRGGLPCRLSTEEGNCVIFVGIIDCFTSYDTRKRLERCFKVCRGEGGQAISVMPALPYSQRFIAAVCDRVFGDDPQATPAGKLDWLEDVAL